MGEGGIINEWIHRRPDLSYMQGYAVSFLFVLCDEDSELSNYNLMEL